jgi:hypothetical protein
MYICCSSCFNDKYLRELIIRTSKSKGICSSCGSNDVSVVDITFLSSYFDSISDIIYEPSDSPEAMFLHEIILKDWSLFSDVLPEEKRQEIMKTITYQHNTPDTKWVPRQKQIFDRVTHWNKFREEIKHVNRFFPKELPAQEHLKALLDSLRLTKDEIPKEIFRAHVNKKGGHHTDDEMKRPPSEKALNGRANPLGISYLYAASNTSTAISEVQPYKGEVVTVAKFQITKQKEIVDLRNPRQTITPFGLEEEELESLYLEIPYLITLGEELSKPIIPKEADLEYLPSQYLCEFIKSLGFTGVLYKSSLGDGYNIALFDDSGTEMIDKKEYQVTDNNISFRQII